MEQVNLCNVIECDYLTAICYRNIPAFHRLQEDLIFRLKRDFKILKEIHNNYYELKKYNIHALSISTAADRNSIATFYFLLSNRIEHRNISTNATVELDTYLFIYRILLQLANNQLYNYTHSHKTTKYFFQMFFKDMNFSKPFQTDALGLLSYPVVRIKNHMIIFLSYFPFPSRFFMALRRSFFEIFRKLQ